MLFGQSKPLSWIRMGQHLPKGQIEEGSVKKVRTKKSFDRHLRDKALMASEGQRQELAII